MKVLGVDFGFGDNKEVFGDETGIKHIRKYPSVIAIVKTNELVSDPRVVPFDGKSFYVGQDALALPTKSIIDIKDYKMLEFAAPIFLYKTLKDLPEMPDKIVIGLSIAQIENSGHFKERILKFLADSGINVQVELKPQGMISKLTIDKYGVDFPNINPDFQSFQTYIGADIGFNTLDIFQVINGKTSTNLVRGIPERGIQVIVARLVSHILETDEIKLTMSEGKQVLDTGRLTRRGSHTEYKEKILELKKEYVQELIEIIEGEFGDILDKCDALVLLGGGAYTLSSAANDFVCAPKEKAEYYNAIAYYLAGLK